MSLLARAVTPTAAGWISSSARVIAAVTLVGHVLLLFYVWRFSDQPYAPRPWRPKRARISFWATGSQSM